MKQVIVVCPKCGTVLQFKSYWDWVWKTQFHWLWWDKETKRIRDYRLTKCPNCGYKGYVKRK